jgi:phosphoribosylaminoimidazole-succinocarboxamide synthase
MSDQVILETEFSGAINSWHGKVRDIYDLGDKLLIVATDRISAFDHILPTGIPGKGKILTKLSSFWFTKMESVVNHHVISTDVDDFGLDFGNDKEVYRGRSMLVRKAEVVPVECVARGYLAGSAWRDYQETGSVCGVKLPAGLREADKLPEPIYTPATKATSGHDINIGFEEVARTVGEETARELKEKSLTIFEQASEFAQQRGLILSDTKFEFGTIDGGLSLIDELLTPDSSRFWLSETYEPGHAQYGFDKQYVRDYLETTGWDKDSPPPPLPDGVVQGTRERYVEALRRITGKGLDVG